MRYGLPYKGSKNKIADKIVDFLPNADTLYDLFGGGASITHCASLSGKYKNIHYNDYDEMTYEYVKNAIDKKAYDKSVWISREDFNRLKKSDGFIKYMWSFGNNGIDYLYGYDIEDFEHRLHEYLFFNDKSVFESKPKPLFEINDVQSRYEYAKKVLDKRLVSYERMKAYDDFCDSINSSQANITLSNDDYATIPISANSVVYCDIPYINTRCSQYKSEFDHKRFYDWALSLNVPIFISEYTMPNDFECVAEIEKFCSINTSDKREKTSEKIFTPKK